MLTTPPRHPAPKIPLSPNAGMEVFLALRDLLPVGWISVFPDTDDKGVKCVFVGDRPSIVAFDAPNDLGEVGFGEGMI